LSCFGSSAGADAGRSSDPGLVGELGATAVVVSSPGEVVVSLMAGATIGGLADTSATDTAAGVGGWFRSPTEGRESVVVPQPLRAASVIVEKISTERRVEFRIAEFTEHLLISWDTPCFLAYHYTAGRRKKSS
jgi:hypothetical protein